LAHCGLIAGRNGVIADFPACCDGHCGGRNLIWFLVSESYSQKQIIVQKVSGTYQGCNQVCLSGLSTTQKVASCGFFYGILCIGLGLRGHDTATGSCTATIHSVS